MNNIRRNSIFDKTLPTSSMVVVCVPTNGLVHARFTYCLTALMDYTRTQGVPIILEMDEGTVLSNQRQVLQDRAIKEYNANHIMWLDSDMTFPPQTVIKLLSHNKQAVCATYSKRVPPFHSTAFESIDPVVPVDVSPGGLISTRYAGMGCMLINSNVVSQIPRPHFPLKWHEQSSTWHGEDMGFCDLLQKANINLYCDLDLSKKLGHLGLQEHRLN